MDPYLVEVAENLDTLTDRGAITDAMDKLEFLYDVLDPHQQDLAEDLLRRLQERLDNLG